MKIRIFWGKSGDKVNLQLVRHLAGHFGQLREATLCHDALQHQVALLGGRSRKQRPDVGDGLLVVGLEVLELLLDLDHFGLVGSAAALGVRAVAVAVAAVGVLVAALHVLDGAALGHGRVESWDVVLEKRGDRLAHELGRHLGAAGGPVFFLGAAVVAVLFGVGGLLVVTVVVVVVVVVMLLLC